MIGKKEQHQQGVFTPTVDSKIIQGFFGDRELMLKELCQAGYTRDEVLDRAESLGLTSHLVKACFHMEDLAVRHCLCCDKEFLSLGHQNRLCRSCRVKT